MSPNCVLNSSGSSNRVMLNTSHGAMTMTAAAVAAPMPRHRSPRVGPGASTASGTTMSGTISTSSDRLSAPAPAAMPTIVSFCHEGSRQ